MADNSKRAIAEILKHEGGYVNHPSDPGGATNKGVTIATFRRYVNPRGTIADLKKLTDTQATIVYKRQYWDAVMGDYLPSGVDYAVADFAVNSGPSRAAKYLQAIVGVSQDGKIGPQTLGAVENMNPADVINKLCDNRLAFMKRIKGGRLWKTFGKGWGRRVADVRRLSLKWAMDDVSAVHTPPVRPDAPATPQAPTISLFARLLAALFNFKGSSK